MTHLLTFPIYLIFPITLVWWFKVLFSHGFLPGLPYFPFFFSIVSPYFPWLSPYFPIFSHDFPNFSIVFFNFFPIFLIFSPYFPMFFPDFSHFSTLPKGCIIPTGSPFRTRRFRRWRSTSTAWGAAAGSGAPPSRARCGGWRTPWRCPKAGPGTAGDGNKWGRMMEVEANKMEVYAVCICVWKVLYIYIYSFL